MTEKMPKYSKTVLLIGLTGLVVGAFGAHLVDGLPWILFFDNLHWTSATAAAAVLSWLALRNAGPDEIVSRTWFSVGLSGYAVGQILWDAQTVVGYTDFPAPSDLFYLWLGPCIAVGLISGMARLTSPAQRKVILLDMLALAVAVVTLVLAVYLPKRGDTGLLALMVMIAYPVTLLGAACVSLSLILSLRLRITSGWLLFSPSILATGWSWMVWNNLALDGTATSGAWFNSTFSVGILMMGVSILFLKFEQSANPAWDRLCEGALRLFPLLTVVMAALAVVFANTLEGVPEIVSNTANNGSFVIIVLATIRQGMLLKERDQLIAAQNARKLAEKSLRLSEDRWQFALEGAGDGVWDWDIASGAVFFSKRWKEMVGYSEQEFENSFEAWATHIHQDDKEQTLARLQDYLTGKSSYYQVEFRMRCKDGSWKWILARGMVASRDENGKPLRMIGTHTDITGRRNVEETVRQSEARLRFMLETSPIAVRIAVDAGHRVIYANQRYAELINAEPGQALGAYPERYYANPQEYADILRQLSTGNQVTNKLIELRIPGNGVRWVLASYLAFEYANEPAVLGWFYDITERKKLEEELQQYRENLEYLVRQRTSELEVAKNAAEQASSAKSEFLSRMSHELRTPMNAILGFSQLLELEPINQEQKDFVNEIHQAGHHLLELINDLLDLSRIEAGRFAMAIDAVTLGTPIEQSIQLVKKALDQNAIKLVNNCEHSIGVYADDTRLKQVLVNLLSNAAKYNCKGGKVTIDSKIIDAGQVRISITDTGPGISPQNMERLFTPFERLGAEFTAIEGTGIGLALSKRLAEMMGGKLGVKSVLGQGSTFWLDLPLAQADVIAAGSGQLPLTTFEGGPDKVKVLYIEDNAANMKLVEGMLRRLPNMSLLSAGNGEYGLELATQYRPRVILLDVHLPGMDGYAVLKELKARPETREIPVIALSADAMPIDIERGLAAGFRHYLTKPLNAEELVGKLNELLAARIENGV